MEIEQFFERVPYLYHLTHRKNIEFIIDQKRLFSTVELVNMSDTSLTKDFLRSKRPDFTNITINGFSVFIRDQKPLTSALARALTDGYTPEKWIYTLNKRVFMWPTLKRLRAHFGTYESTKPIIIRLSTREVFAKNRGPELCKINSGDSRCIAYYGGNPMSRGPQTFKRVKDYEFEDVAEVTFPGYCILPNVIEIGDSPEGNWKKVDLK